ncbi:MAG: HEPN domain-containing protein [bacterium]|nr:HEPN domain-containing protein [bacterium]
MEGSRDRNKSLNGKDYLKSARQKLRSAKVLLDTGNYGDSISRSYYAFLDAATTGLITKDLLPKSHTGAIDLFSLHFIKTNLVETKYIKWFKRIKKDREDADYKHKREFTKEDAEETYYEAEEFVRMIEELFSELLKGRG